MTRGERRDPKKRANRMERRQLVDLAPTFPWKEYFAAMGQPGLASLHVAAPPFFPGAEKALQGQSVRGRAVQMQAIQAHTGTRRVKAITLIAVENKRNANVRWPVANMLCTDNPETQTIVSTDAIATRV